MYKQIYKTPDSFDDILIACDGEYLTELSFIDSKDAAKHIIDCEEKNLPTFEETITWLDIYFSGENPKFSPKYKISNLTPFRQEVIDIMNTVKFGETITYNEIAKTIALKRGLKRMSAQAVGGAVGWNPICIIIPCHRVVGTNKSLTGYGGGLKNKAALLSLEKNDMSKFTVPKKGTAL